MTKNPEEPQQPTLYTPAEVANFFRVDPKTVTRWARTGTLNPVTLPSGHRRYHASEIHRLLQTGNAPDPHDLPADDGTDTAPASNPRANAILNAVIRDYFDGDPIALIKAVRDGLT
ncbi:helix-turn-helix domain-containing protein [Actinomadura rayongensis]|uniref:Helix-turn-helix domain-containing protein n=1 Tax=Actinomadura rayongensis TaxID=1429076 RepID=A0A6I4VW46_9ACTN|nr:helix-turn-helix domain-containing protein [Actinomadura rayongensis]